jgi:hypothetical protein
MVVLKMLCPFSHQLCNGCALFRGGHWYLCWYLCFCKEYRGYIGKPKEVSAHRIEDNLREREGLIKDVN